MHLSDLSLLFYNEPITILSVILLSGVITVNGWTDAPTAIATCITTKSLTPKKAIILASFMNFAGVALMSAVSGKVTDTVSEIVDLGNNTATACITLCATMITIIVWAVTAWFFGIPTSESHALISALSGAAVAQSGDFTSISVNEIKKVISGLFLSVFTGFLSGFLFTKITIYFIKNRNRIITDTYFRHMQNIAAALMAFMHGAQDGQKFIGVFILIKNYSSLNNTTNNISLIFFVSLLMAAGTSIGGIRIIKKMGNDMVRLKKYQGFSADLSGSFSLLLSTLTGLPVSTTHTKTTAIMGVGIATDKSGVDWKIAKEMIITWLLTFPGCGFLGYLITCIFLTVR